MCKGILPMKSLLAGKDPYRSGQKLFLVFVLLIVSVTALLVTTLKYLKTDTLIWLPATIIFISFAIFLYGHIIRKTMIQPIDRIMDVLRDLKSGEYSSRIVLEGNNDINAIAEAINQAARSLEKKVFQRQRFKNLITTITTARSIEQFGNIILNHLAGDTNSTMGLFSLQDEESSRFVHRVFLGFDDEAYEKLYSARVESEFVKALALQNIVRSPIKESSDLVGEITPMRYQFNEMIIIPIIVNNQTAAIITMASEEKYQDSMIEYIEEARPVINTVFSNLLYFERSSTLNSELDKKNLLLKNGEKALKTKSKELEEQTVQVQRQSQQLERQRRIVEESDNLKNEFLTNMNHELRTPLNSIIALSRVLSLKKKEGEAADEEKKYLDIIHRNGKHLLSMINDILDLSKIESGKIDLKPKKIHLARFIEAVIEHHQGLAGEKGIELSNNVPESLPSIVSDENRLDQIFQNIIGNAVKFTHRGSVEVCAEVNDEYIALTVKDTGIGIEPNHLPTVFEGFRPVDGKLSREYEGTGLGLVIAKKSSALLGGDISVRSTPGVGSEFRIILPLEWYTPDEKPADGRMEKAGTEATVHAGNKSPEKEKRDAVRKKILVVEDDPDNMVTLRALMQKDYDILEARKGEEAVELLPHKPDTILLDLHLPDMNGLDLLRMIREREGMENVPVIAITAFTMSGDRDTILKAGCDDYIAKPINIDSFFQVINKWIKKTT